ncbi:MAG: DUF1559 domain-containing protein [Planctomycetota bacterium]
MTARASDTITSQFPSTTFAVVHLDIAEIDVEAVAKLLPEDARLRFKRQLQGVLGQLSSAGLTDVYVSMDLASLIPPKPVMVTNAGVQMTDAMKPMLGAISETLFPGEELEVQLSSGRVYVGTKQAVQRFRSPNATVDLSSALDSDFDHAVVLRWNPQTADTFSQIWPQQLPLGNGVSINASMLAKQIESVAIEFSLPPNESARLSLQPREGTDLNAIREQLNPVARMIQDDFQIEISGSTDPGELTWELKSGQSAVIADLIRDLRGSAQQSQTMNDLKQVLLAFHNHYSVHGEFPKDISREGEALLSWRVKVLPFLDQSALYQTFDVTKSWDDTANQVPAKMVVPTYSKQEDAKTQIRLPVCKGSIWDGDGKITFDKMIDGTSNTIAVIIAPQSAATSWTQPGYFRLNEQDLVGSVFGDQDRLIAGFADGSVQVFTRDEMSEERLRAMLTFAGREMFKR